MTAKRSFTERILAKAGWNIKRQEMNIRSLLEAAFIGALTGLAAALFIAILDLSASFFLGRLAGFAPPRPAGEPSIFELPAASTISLAAILLLPALGGLVSGILTRFAPEAKGAGTDSMVKAFHLGGGVIRGRVPILKALASIFVLGTGGSAGREGPIIQIGAGIGSNLGSFLHMTPRRRRLLLLAGAAGGVGAMFRAPLGGAIAAVEIIYQEDFESEALLGAIVSSVTAFAVFSFFFGQQTIFQVPLPLFLKDPRELVLYFLLGIPCAMGGILFIRCFRSVEKLFERLPGPAFLKPALGGLAVGAIGVFVPEVLGTGWGYLEKALQNRYAAGFLLLLALLKIAATSLTIGSGGSGGVFGPSLFIGGMLGGAVGLLFQQLFPGLVFHPESFVLVGMAGFFAGVAKAPLGALVMVTEMTGSYRLMAPLMIVCVSSVIFTRRWTIYPSQVKTRFDSPVHRESRMIDLLAETRLKDFPRRSIDAQCFVAPNTPVSELARRVKHEDVEFFVVMWNGKVEGLIEAEELMAVLAEGECGDLLAHDLAVEIPVLPSEETARAAADMMAATGVEHAVVIEETPAGVAYSFIEARDFEDSRIIRSLRKDPFHQEVGADE